MKESIRQGFYVLEWMLRYQVSFPHPAFWLREKGECNWMLSCRYQ